MKSKSEITYEYIQLINKVDRNVEEYESYLRAKYDELEELSKNNEGITLMVEKLDQMKSTVNNLKVENEYAKMAIRQNEYKF